MKLNKIIKFIFDKDYRFITLGNYGFYKRMNDSVYLKKRYKALTGKKLNMDRPKTFNEKLQWLKVNDRKEYYSKMVDKYDAKEYVKEICPSINVIKTIGIYDHFDDINLDSLPDKFVIKCTHNSNCLIICRDKSKFDGVYAKKQLEKGLKDNFYTAGREWPYKNLRRRIIVEEYMEDDSGEGLMDYKFYCFNGVPKFLYISKGLENHATAAISFVTLNWQFAPYERSDYKPFEKLPKQPACFEQMIQIAKILSKEMPFLRVDLYEINNKVYFSELTFYPCAGAMPFKNDDHDLELGNMIHLPIDD
ncbi:MAG: ATP-grasp fold amidoligase family protein [Bacillales bacterium]|nr:ATP-grasp fold amidoligase family protein [Bacillales bacterium]